MFDDYICASILNTEEGYTPAYDLKGVAIQILSFFSSETLEQEYGGPVRDLTAYRRRDGTLVASYYGRPCTKCGFDGHLSQHGHEVTRSAPSASPGTDGDIERSDGATELHKVLQLERNPTDINSLPDEVLCLICDGLETEELVVFASAWNRIGSIQGMVTKYNLIRNRELLCFCLKKSFDNAKLGVGISVTFEDRGTSRARQGMLSSEFDLLSLQAFEEFHIDRSVQDLPFGYWVPLPLYRKHYISISPDVGPRLHKLREVARLDGGRSIDTTLCFMNDIVVKLSTEAQIIDRSALGRASERAIESYFHLFHLLLCQATEDPAIVRAINKTLQGVLDGRSSKQEIPNLGHLLISVLISDADMTQDLLMAITRETVTRKVVWMLDRKGSNMPEFAYMEADTISRYRLEKTFEASKTSYRLLMFLNLFRQTIDRGNGQSRKSLVQMRDELFDAHGAPPRGTAAKLAKDIRALQQVDSFPKFLVIMGLTPPAASQFTIFLRNCMEESVRKGYSIWGIGQERALTLRRQKDPSVQVNENPKPEWQGGGTFEITFFPNRGGRGGGRGAQGGARGRGRGGRGY